MMTDLIDRRTDKEKLLDYIRDKKIVFTHEVIEFGVKNHSNRADRNARQLATEGKIRRMSDERKKQVFWYKEIKEDVWELLPDDNDYLK